MKTRGRSSINPPIGLLLLLLVLSSLNSRAQEDSLVQFSGVIMTSDSLRGIPYAHIIIKNVGRGTISNYEGFFSFVAAKGDSIRFSCIGYEVQIFVIPGELETDRYSVIQLMTRDTFHLPETIIYPWPTLNNSKKLSLA